MPIDVKFMVFFLVTVKAIKKKVAKSNIKLMLDSRKKEEETKLNRGLLQSDEVLRFLLFFTLIRFSHFDLISSQAFLRSMFASEDESDSESLESESLDELSFFFFFFFTTFFCFFAFFDFDLDLLFFSSSLSDSSLSSFLTFFLTFLFFSASLSESSLSSRPLFFFFFFPTSLSE